MSASELLRHGLAELVAHIWDGIDQLLDLLWAGT
jgi:hypothetical protein